MIGNVLGTIWHVGGMFALPFLMAFLAALFLEVSEVAETLPVLVALAVVAIVPSFVLQVAGLWIKVSRELHLLRARRAPAWADVFAATHRHASIVTARGWAVLGAGVFFILLSLGMQWASLSVLGVLALLLFHGVVGITSFAGTFLAGAFDAGLHTRRGSVERVMMPAVVLAGDVADERFTFRRVFVPPGYNLLIEDKLPLRLGTISRYAVGAGARRDELHVGGRLRRSPRGLYLLGPASIYYQDLLGLTRVSLASLATAELKVLPRFRELVVVEPPRTRNAAPDVLTRPHRIPTEDHFRFREYAPGDDTRRIHWKLSIRTGHLTLRQPETREVSSKTILLVLDSYLPAGRMLSDAVGVEEVLDRLVETWISLAKALVERGDTVTMVAVARGQSGLTEVETQRCAKGGHARWQDLGARSVWQGQADIPKILELAAQDTHAVVVSSRFQAPPPQPFAGASLTWVYLPPDEALGTSDPSLLDVLMGGPGRALRWFFQTPHPAGADENGLFAQLREFHEASGRLAARRRLRQIARAGGAQTLQLLVQRGDAVYKLVPGAKAHRLVGVSGGTAARTLGAA